MKILLVILALAIAGCATPAQQPVVSQTSIAVKAQITVFATKGAYEAATAIATAYAELPRCAVAVPQPCSKAEVVAQVRRARLVTRDAILAAEETVRSPAFEESVIGSAAAAAEASMKAYMSITNTLQR